MERGLADTHIAARAGLAHHFDDIEQQREAGTLGMWAFLVTEVMFFGGLFLAYILYRSKYPVEFAVASNSLNVTMGVINTLVQYLPHLLALSANSPFWQGVDTGLASCRAALFQLAPHSGMPRHFARWKDFCTYCQVIRQS